MWEWSVRTALLIPPEWYCCRELSPTLSAELSQDLSRMFQNRLALTTNVRWSVELEFGSTCLYQGIARRSRRYSCSTSWLGNIWRWHLPGISFSIVLCSASVVIIHYTLHVHGPYITWRGQIGHRHISNSSNPYLVVVYRGFYPEWNVLITYSTGRNSICSSYLLVFYCRPQPSSSQPEPQTTTTINHGVLGIVIRWRLLCSEYATSAGLRWIHRKPITQVPSLP